MPTMADLGMLANQLYKDGQWDQDAATALGFTSPPFSLWSGGEYDSLKANYFYFSSTYSNYFNVLRVDSDTQAVCLGE